MGADEVNMSCLLKSKILKAIHLNTGIFVGRRQNEGCTCQDCKIFLEKAASFLSSAYTGRELTITREMKFSNKM